MKKFVNFAKGRIFISLFSYITGIIFVDWLGLKYWLFAILFIPINWFISYKIYSNVFKNKGVIINES